MEQQARRYRLWLCFALGQAHSRIASLLAHYQGDAEAVFRDAKHHCLPEKNQREAGLNRQLYQKAEEGYIDRCLAYMERHRIQAVLLEDANYPKLLKEIQRPPTCLYVRGRLPEVIHLPIAMIGSRNCSENGKRIAMTMARDLSSAGVCVVSGLAYGIDGLCAKGALEAADNPFPTIAVLGCGWMWYIRPRTGSCMSRWWNEGPWYRNSFRGKSRFLPISPSGTGLSAA